MRGIDHVVLEGIYSPHEKSEVIRYRDANKGHYIPKCELLRKLIAECSKTFLSAGCSVTHYAMYSHY